MIRDIQLIVLDGQPGGGKDFFLQMLEADPWFMRNAVIETEAAALLYTAHKVQPGEFGTVSQDTIDAFQNAIASLCMFKRSLAVDRAVRDGKKLVVFNRFIPSGAAYLQWGIVDLMAITNLSEVEMNSGIDHVICPGPPPEEHYVTNEYRFETYAEACVLGARARQAYIDLGFVPGTTLHDIPGGDDFDAKCALFMATIRQLTGAEH